MTTIEIDPQDPAVRERVRAAITAAVERQPCSHTELAQIALDALDERVPEEPPKGTVLRGEGQGIWTRMDRTPHDLSNARWYRAGDFGAYTWREAVAAGADPTRPLVDALGGPL